MKFTKEEAYKELVAKMTAKGETLNLSERSLMITVVSLTCDNMLRIFVKMYFLHILQKKELIVSHIV